MNYLGPQNGTSVTRVEVCTQVDTVPVGPQNGTSVTVRRGQ